MSKMPLYRSIDQLSIHNAVQSKTVPPGLWTVETTILSVNHLLITWFA